MVNPIFHSIEHTKYYINQQKIILFNFEIVN